MVGRVDFMGRIGAYLVRSSNSIVGNPAFTSLSNKLPVVKKWGLLTREKGTAMGKGLRLAPVVNIVICNYNYGRFLREAIDSALGQTYTNVEVVVVDDGSTDDSREIIASYGDRIVPVLKENGGHASAINEGFSVSKGEIIIFLDADDMLLPDTVRRVVEAFQDRPSVVKVQYRLQITDARGQPTGELSPPSHQSMPNGDLRQHVLRFHSYRWSGMGSGFTSEVLRRILPMPEDLYRVSPDGYLKDMSVMLGSIASLDEVGALYRWHGKNDHQSARLLNLVRLRENLLRTEYGRAKQRHLFKALYSADVQEVGAWDLTFLRGRVVSLKLDPLNHPFSERLPSLCARGCVASVIYPGMCWYERFVYALWFLVMLFVPKALAESLTERVFHREKRGRLMNKLLTGIRRI